MVELPQVEFKPPSDFVEESGGGGGGGGKKWLKIAGIGCGVVLLIIGILFAAGAFQVVSCCGDIQSISENTQQAGQVATGFGEHVLQGDWEQAHGLLTPDAQEKMDPGALEARFDEHRARLEGATPILRDITAASQPQNQQELRAIDSWRVRLRFHPSSGNVALDAVLVLELISPAEDEEPPELGVSSLQLERRELDPRSEPPARVVLALHGDLQADRFDRAFRQLAPQMQKEQSQVEFRDFILSQGELFTRSTMKLQEVRYASNQKAQVVALLQIPDGKKAVVTYDLIRDASMPGMWRVVGISPLVETTGEVGADATAPSKEPGQEAGADGRAPGQGDEDEGGETEGGEASAPEDEGDEAAPEGGAEGGAQEASEGAEAGEAEGPEGGSK